MNQLTDSQKQKIQLLQNKVDKYQRDPILCASLTPEQCSILAELQTIYNNLSNQTLTNDSAIFSTTCKGVIDEIKRFTTIYTNIEPKQLYMTYLTKYKEARTGSNEMNGLNKLDIISSEDLIDISNTKELLPKT